MQLSVKTKIVCAFAATITFVSLFAGILLQSEQNLASLMNEMLQKNISAMRFAEQIKYTVVLHDDLVFRYLATDDPVLLAESGRMRQKISDGIQQMKNVASNRTEQELLRELEEETAQYSQDVKALIHKYQAKTPVQKKSIFELLKGAGSNSLELARKKKKATIALLSAEGRARLTRVYSLCEKLADISRSILETSERHIDRTVLSTRRTTLTVGAGVVLLTAAIAILLGISLLKPLQNLIQGVQKITTGDLNLELPVKRPDEIGTLTRAFNIMATRLREKQEELMSETITDALTGLHNFRYFQTYLKNEIRRASRYAHPFALLIADIDHFKNFNDKNGHPMGNVILKQVASILKESLREDSFIARYGGEEFVIVLPETDLHGAKAASEHLRKAIEASLFPGQNHQPGGKLTISLGGATFPRDSEVSSQLIEKADRALYAAKSSGRNCTVWAEELGMLKIA